MESRNAAHRDTVFHISNIQILEYQTDDF